MNYLSVRGWLPIRPRITFKTAVLVWKCLHDKAPRYLADQSSDFHWPAELRGVRPRNLEQSISFVTRPRTVAEHLQAPAEDTAFPARVNHRPAPL